MASARLKMSGVRKAFGPTHALRGVDLEVLPGEIHALIGENGAGKSTLMKILSGACRADGGTIELEGGSFQPGNPLHARRCGVVMIYQELMLAPHLTVQENILLGIEPSRWGWIRARRMKEMARSALTKLDHPNLPLDAPVSGLSIAEQQIVEIARALIGQPRVLVMDEPTSSLTQLDAQSLFKVLRQLKDDLGVSIVYISHFLEECQSLCDRYTVLRDGETVGTGSMEGVALEEIIRLMVGRDLKDIYPRSRRAAGKVLLQVDGLKGEKRPSDVSFQVREGEILGVAGLVGAGRTETLRAVFGLDPMKAGGVRVREQSSKRRSPRRTLGQGVGLLSENRKEEGLLLNRSIADNLTMTRFDPVSRFGLISSTRQRAAAQQWIEKLQVKTENPFQAINELSGGNQQKVAMGRLLHHDADVYLLDEPTRGIDVGSKAQIYQIMSELANRGKAVVFVSSYLPELLGICDTIGVMCRGRMIDVRSAEQWTEHEIMAAAIGQEESGVSSGVGNTANEPDRGSHDPSKSLTPRGNRFQSGDFGAKHE